MDSSKTAERAAGVLFRRESGETVLRVRVCPQRMAYTRRTLEKQRCYLMPFKGVSEIVPLESRYRLPKVLFLALIVPLQRH